VQGTRPVLDTMLANRTQLPAVRFDCGLSDPLLEKNRALTKALRAVGIPHEYHEFPGGHDWPYWERHLVESLLFFAQQK
jgi:putative tributyrin esterase